MSLREDDEQKPVVAIFRSAVFNASERFIQDQAAALARWRPLVVGLERKGEMLPRLREAIVANGVSERLAFRLRGRGGRIEAELLPLRIRRWAVEVIIFGLYPRERRLTKTYVPARRR